nr:hypothetical protein 440p1_00039 [Serratia entomophila]
MLYAVELCFQRGANCCHIFLTRYIAPGTFAITGEPTNLDMSNNPPLSPLAKPISDYQTAFSTSQLARELANGTPGSVKHWRGALYLRVMRALAANYGACC